ncbi:MAG TPA: right-handed parallel beta-helix repeat-containing protein [Thermoanaerobaculia bacterium]|nr:right-handed parallel beta-helix repeat-containing protein [Thermoanaerobaculia bacterium]
MIVVCSPGLAFAFVAALALNDARAAVYYVAPSGSDAWPGTIAQPWRTLEKAASSLAPGDTAYLRAGTYNERLIPRTSGSFGAMITFASYPGEIATIDGTGIEFSTDEGQVDLSQREFIRLSHLRVTNASGAAIYTDGGGSFVIEGCSVDTAGGSGVGIWNAHDVLVDGNEIVAVCTRGWQEHLTIANTNGFEVRNNHVHHTAPGNPGKEGICIKDGTANGSVHDNHVHDVNFNGIYVDGSFRGVSNVEVAANRVHDIRGEHAGNCISIASEAGGLNQNVRVVNNLGYDCAYSGLHVTNCCPQDAPHHPLKSIVIINNTFVHNGREPWGGGLVVENDEIEGVVVRNNLISDNYMFQLAADAGAPPARLVIDHNLIDGFRGTENEIVGADAVQAPAMLADPANGDFRLRAGSPAIDRGSAASAPNCDFAGSARPGDGDSDGVVAVDIGAYEWHTAGTKRRAVAPHR